MERKLILEKLKKKKEAGHPIVGAGAGTGISAVAAENGGADLIVIYNSGKFRMSGRGSLAGFLCYGNANEIMLEMGKEVIPVVKNTPVIAGVCGTDPFMIPNILFRDIQDMGFSGIQNFPTVGLIDGMFRQNLEETGMGFNKEVEIVKQAHSLDLLTTPYIFNIEEAQLMAEAGADVLVAHMGLTIGSSSSGISGKSLESSLELIQKICNAAKKIRPDIIVLCHGGPISHPEDFNYIFNNCQDVDGFFGASSIERYPVESSIANEVEKFSSQYRKSKSGGILNFPKSKLV